MNENEIKNRLEKIVSEVKSKNLTIVIDNLKIDIK